MARITLQDENTQVPEIKMVFDEIKAKTGGKIPAAYRAFGVKSHILQANWNRTKRILGEGNLPMTLKESIALAVSNSNGCKFCVNIHQSNLANQGFSADEVGLILDAESSDIKTEAVLQFCIQATKNPELLTDADFENLKNMDYSDEDILEMLTVMEMYTGYNKIIVALGINIDD